MKKKYGVIFFICLCISLCVMYGTELGIPGITKYYDDFKLLDMHFSYNYDTVVQTFANIGTEGMLNYQRYLLVDLSFIVCLWLVQAFLNTKIQHKKVRNVTFLLISLRAAFDLVENTMIFIMLRDQSFVRQSYITILSTITSCKFIFLYSWIALTCIWWLRRVFLKYKK